MAKVECPGCDVEFDLGKRILGERFQCRECGRKLEVVSIQPPDVSWAYRYDDQDGDWDYDDYEDYEEVDHRLRKFPV
jgi:lysine biosynthesis protein LysW